MPLADINTRKTDREFSDEINFEKTKRKQEHSFFFDDKSQHELESNTRDKDIFLEDSISSEHYSREAFLERKTRQGLLIDDNKSDVNNPRANFRGVQSNLESSQEISKARKSETDNNTLHHNIYKNSTARFIRSEIYNLTTNQEYRLPVVLHMNMEKKHTSVGTLTEALLYKDGDARQEMPAMTNLQALAHVRLGRSDVTVTDASTDSTTVPLPVHKRMSVQYSSLVGPSFLNTTYHSQVRALAGQTALLACVVRNLHNNTVRYHFNIIKYLGTYASV